MRWLLLPAKLAAAAASFLVGTGLTVGARGLIDVPPDGPADAAVILGNRVRPDGRPSQQLAGRLARGLEAWRLGQARLLVVSGGRGREGFEEADVMAAWLEARGVPRDRIVVDRAGWTTWDTARRTRALGLRSVVVVTSWYHVPRTRLALRRAGVPVAGCLRARHGASLRDPYSVVREGAAFWWYLLRPAA